MRTADGEASCDAINRRTFLHRLEAASGVALTSRVALPAIVPLIVTACAGARYAPASLIGDRLRVARVDLGVLGALVEAPGQALPLFVRPMPGGAFAAISTRCTHRGCQVDPTPDRLICPCHGSEYTLDGDVLKGPAELALRRFHATSDETYVFVLLDQPLETRPPT